MSLCSGATEELKDLNKFELATPLDLLGGEISSEGECDYLVTGHESGVCILWKVAKKEYFCKILEIDVGLCLDATGDKKKADARISATHMFGKIITVGLESGDVVEFKLCGVAKDGSKILWDSKILRRAHRTTISYIRRSQNALVIVDKSSATSVRTPDGKLLSFFQALDGFDCDTDIKITYVSIWPRSLICYGFSNGAWRLYNFLGFQNSLGSFAEINFDFAITYIAWLNQEGKLRKCKPSGNALSVGEVDISSEVTDYTPSQQPSCPTEIRSVPQISAKLRANNAKTLNLLEDQHLSSPNLQKNCEKPSEENIIREVFGSQPSDKWEEVRSQATDITPPRHRTGNEMQDKSSDFYRIKVGTDISKPKLKFTFSDVLSNAKTRAAIMEHDREKNPSNRKFKLCAACGVTLKLKGNKSEPVPYWTRDAGIVSQERESNPWSALSEVSSIANLVDRNEQNSRWEIESIVDPAWHQNSMALEEKKEPTPESWNEDTENSYLHTTDGYLVICSRDIAVVIQITPPSYQICARYSFESPLLGAQVVSKESGKVGLVTISENGTLTIFRLMDLHVIHLTNMKIPSLMNMHMLPEGRYVAVSKSMEFYHGGFFEIPAELSFIVPTDAPIETDNPSGHKTQPNKERPSIFSLFSQKPEFAIDSWDDAVEAFERPNSLLIPSKSEPKEDLCQISSDPEVKQNEPSCGRVRNKNLEKMIERGNKISGVADRSAQLNHNAERNLDLVKQLRSKNRRAFLLCYHDG